MSGAQADSGGAQADSGGAQADSRKLDKAFAGGVAWSAGVKYLTQIITWGGLVITARLLSPAEFGISEMASIFVVITGVLAEFGVGTAVLQMREMEESSLRQMHTFSCIFCTTVFTLSLLAIPFLTAFFKLQGLGLLFAANSVAFLITGFQAVPLALLERDMDYRRISVAEATQVILQSFVTVAVAWAGWGYWSLTTGAWVGKMSAAILVNIWKPVSFAPIRWSEIRKPVRLGGQVSIGRLAWSAYIQSDGIVVGRVLGDSALGLYRMAMNLASAPAEKISGLLMRAAGPLFARVQDDLTAVRRYFLILTELLVLAVLPLMLGLSLVAREAVELVLEPKWLAAAGPLQVLAMYMILRPLNTLAEQVLISQRRTRFTMSMSIATFCILPIAFYFAARWDGPVGVAGAWLVLAPITILPMLIKLLRTIQLSVGEFLMAILPAVSGCAVMVPAVLMLKAWIATHHLPLAVRLGVAVAGGGLTYSAVLLICFRQRLLRYTRFVKDLRGAKEVAVPA